MEGFIGGHFAVTEQVWPPSAYGPMAGSGQGLHAKERWQASKNIGGKEGARGGQRGDTGLGLTNSAPKEAGGGGGGGGANPTGEPVLGTTGSFTRSDQASHMSLVRKHSSISQVFPTV